MALGTTCTPPQIPSPDIDGECYTPLNSAPAASPDLGARQSGLIICGNTLGDQCTFADVLKEVQVVINFIIFKFASPLAAIMFAYAGFLYVTNGGNESQIKEAHEIFWNVFLGFVIMLAAWLIVNFILTFFLGANSPFSLLDAARAP